MQTRRKVSAVDPVSGTRAGCEPCKKRRGVQSAREALATHRQRTSVELRAVSAYPLLRE